MSNKYYKIDTEKTIPFIVGPTAAGKTSTAIAFAEKMDGEIISVDSRQIYKEMDIGTAKPSEKERNRVKHYLIGSCSLNSRISAGMYRKMALDRVEKVLEKDKLPIFVGGSGMYVRAVTQGFFQGSRTDEEIRNKIQEELDRKGKEKMYEKLKNIDPEYAQKTHKNDTKRVTRALEIYEMKGKPPTELYKEQKENPPFPHVIYGLHRDRDKLYERINKRVDEMIEEGLIEEVRELREEGYREKLNNIKTVGYYELNQYFENEITLEEAIKRIKKNTRNYAKRQISWFKNQLNTNWIEADDKSSEEIANDIIEQYRGEQ